MLVAIISDVHSNIIAFQTVLDEIDRLDSEIIVCAGDIVGYYPFPNQTLEIFKRRGIISILGNHDKAVIHFNTVGMNKLAAEAARWTSENINAENVDYLKTLKSSRRIGMGPVEAAMFHGSPRDDNEYLYEIDTGPELLEMCGCQCMITGHTHIPFVRRIEEGVMINPGAVGQPRDGDSRASFAILDTKNRGVAIHRLEYDIREVQESVLDASLPPFLGERLEYGF